MTQSHVPEGEQAPQQAQQRCINVDTTVTHQR